MEINFYATLRQIAGQKTVAFDLSGDVTVQDILDAVVERFPRMRDELLDEDGNLYPHVHLFINGRDAPYLPEAMDTVVHPSDKVDFFPAVAGG